MSFCYLLIFYNLSWPKSNNMKKRESVQHIMATEPIALQLNDGLSKAEQLFKTHRVRHLPVVSG